MRIFNPLGHALEFLAKPTAPLHAGVATRETDDVVLGKEGVEGSSPPAW